KGKTRQDRHYRNHAKAHRPRKRPASQRSALDAKSRLTTTDTLNGIEAYLVKAAVGERDETGTLIQTNMDYGGGTIGQGHGETVRIRPLLDILTDAKVNKVDVLKIDIEGYEDRALMPFFRDAPSTLFPSHIIMEYSESDRWQSDLMGKLAQAGYRQTARSRGNALLSRK
ncbi:FkbM family methyltransferase, partial [Komagataeibacter sp. SM21]